MSHYSEDSFFAFHSVDHALSKARNLLIAEMEVALSGTGVTSSQVGALLLLSRGIARSPAGLSKLLGADPGFVSRVVDRLERQGLVRRARNSLDRRVVNLALTEAGRDAATRIAEIAPAVLNRRLSGFTSLEFATLFRLLGKLLDG
ncbi:MarR family winged helix-turn-helix transcriptional regulator [Trinickia mobilis]|uniref:MarR family winged helix-turn-helix transcriptional regulator n=1 Tax=Trinickia mobilis TaxID=2816356 RepID=UPI001A908D1F|nr:MarR family transcriptional regulator [Trinickia mobilis]